MQVVEALKLAKEQGIVAPVLNPVPKSLSNCYILVEDIVGNSMYILPCVVASEYEFIPSEPSLISIMNILYKAILRCAD